MTTPRWRIVRSGSATPGPDPRQVERLRKLSERLTARRAALARWMTRLRRAFHPVEQRLLTTARVEREITKEGGPMAQRIIEVTVSPTGEATVQTRGYAGADCLQASHFLEQSLGVVVKDTRTAEYHQAAAARQQVQQ
jgi:hypothetical protein